MRLAFAPFLITKRWALVINEFISMWTLMVILQRAEPLRARSIGLSLIVRHHVLPKGGNFDSLGLNRPSRSDARPLHDSTSVVHDYLLMN